MEVGQVVVVVVENHHQTGRVLRQKNKVNLLLLYFFQKFKILCFSEDLPTFGGGKIRTESGTMREALKKALEQNKVPQRAQRIKHWRIDDENPDAHKKAKEDATKPGHYYKKPELTVFQYKNADGKTVKLRLDTPRSYKERRAAGSTDTSGAQKVHFNVNIETSPGVFEDTGQHHFFL